TALGKLRPGCVQSQPRLGSAPRNARPVYPAEQEVPPMLGRTRPVLSLSLLLIVAAAASGQNLSFDDPPKVYVPKQPPTRAEVERRDALKKYVYGLLCEREERLIEALDAYQEAAKLDPDAAACFKAQIPLLVALERATDAVAACRRAAERD